MIDELGNLGIWGLKRRMGCRGQCVVFSWKSLISAVLASSVRNETTKKGGL